MVLPMTTIRYVREGSTAKGHQMEPANKVISYIISISCSPQASEGPASRAFSQKQNETPRRTEGVYSLYSPDSQSHSQNAQMHTLARPLTTDVTRQFFVSSPCKHVWLLISTMDKIILTS